LADAPETARSGGVHAADASNRAHGPAAAGGVVAVLADDLIWASRLADAITAAGGTPRRIRRTADLDGAPRAIVDLTARAYDGVDAVRAASRAGARVVAVGQHDDAALRRAALEAGAERVFTYRALFEGGEKLIGAWLAR
jgi:hypothetical protein